MSSSGTPTPHLGLNQWLPNDKPERADFNSDNQKIETHMNSISQDVGGVANYLEDVTTFGLTNDSAVRYGKYAMGNVLKAAPNSSVAVGRYALQNVTGVGNVAVGDIAGRSITSGSYNIAIGYDALYTATTHVGNIAIGADALKLSTAHYNTAVGHRSMQVNTTGDNNTAIGTSTLQNNTTGTYNTAIGFAAAYANTTGGSNVAIGREALRANSSGNCNVGVGYASGYGNPDGTGNSMVGYFTLRQLTSGSYNVAMGYKAGDYLSDGTTAQTTTNSSIFIGTDSRGSSSNAQSNQIVIGHYARGYGSNTAHIGNSSVASISYGAATGTAFTNRSDPRIKENIVSADLDTCVDNVKNLPLHYFKYKDFVGNEGDRHVLGFLSSEFGEILPKAVHRNTMTFDERDENGNVIYETRLVDELVDEEVEVEVEILKEMIDPETGETHMIPRTKIQTEMRPVLRQVVKEVPKQIIIEDCESIDSSQLVPILWGAMQKLIMEIEVLKA